MIKDNYACVVIPVFNPEPGLNSLVSKLLQKFPYVVVVDDGSTENVSDFSKLPAKVILLRHPYNKGKGRAIKTAFEWIVKNLTAAKVVVLADGDGQHLVKDIENVSAQALSSGRITLGVRDFSVSNIPFRSRFGNILTSFLVRLIYKIKIYDTQTGLRAFPVRYIQALLTIPGERYEYEMRLFGFIHEREDVIEQVAIETVYLQNNRASHFRPIADSIRVYSGLFGGCFFRFCGASILGFLVDNVVFTFMLFCLHPLDVSRELAIIVSLCVARSLSCSINFACNRKLVFNSNKNIGVAAFRYLTLVVIVIAMSWLFTSVLSAVLGTNGLGITFVKICVETALFVLSYYAQKKWVFN